AANGWAGLKAVTESPPDLILLDLMMPEMDGFEFLRLVRLSQTGRQIPVVVITAKDLTEADRAMLTGAGQEILQKGAFDQQELFAALEAAVTKHVSRRQAEAARPASTGSDGASLGTGSVRELQAQVQHATAERDAALAELHQMREAQVAPAADQQRLED